MVPALCPEKGDCKPGLVHSRKELWSEGAKVKAEPTGKVELILTLGVQVEDNYTGAGFF